MNECVTMRFNIDNTNSKVGIKQVKAILKRRLFLKTNTGLATYRETNMITLPLPGCKSGDKIDEKIVQFDLNQAKDVGTPPNLGGALAEFAGKIQQTCNGRLIDVKYELHILVEIDGCVCCENQPFVYTPIEILAPERVLIFQQYVYPVEGVQPGAGEEGYTEGIPAQSYPQGPVAVYPQAPAPDYQSPQLQYAGTSGAKMNGAPINDSGAMPAHKATQPLKQKRADDTPIDNSSGEDV